MWKDINGWEEYYEVNTDGEVRNKLTRHILIGDINTGGYCRVCLYHKGHSPEKERFFRHRLVAQHFIDNPQNLPEVNHKDCNTLNNSVENLEWVSKKENELHSRKYGCKEYKPIRTVWNNGESKTYNCCQEVATDCGVTKGAVKFWVHGKNKGYLKHGISEIKYIINS